MHKFGGILIMEKFVCKTCNVTFEKPRGKPRYKYCSVTCRNTSRKLSKKLLRTKQKLAGMCVQFCGNPVASNLTTLCIDCSQKDKQKSKTSRRALRESVLANY